MALHSRDRFAQLRSNPLNTNPDFSDSAYWLIYDDMSTFQPVADWQISLIVTNMIVMTGTFAKKAILTMCLSMPPSVRLHLDNSCPTFALLPSACSTLTLHSLTLTEVCTTLRYIILYMLFWCQAAVLRAASISLYLQYALKCQSYWVPGDHFCLWESACGGYTDILIAFKLKKCPAWFSEWAVCAHVFLDGCELCSRMPFAAAESLIPDLFTQHPRKPSPLSMRVCLSMWMPVYVCYCESNVLYVWVETGLFALSTFCLYRCCIQCFPDVSLCLLVPVCPCLWYPSYTLSHSIVATPAWT